MISAVLLFTEADSDLLIDFSKQINKQTSSLIELDKQFLPHITLAQFNAPDEAAAKLWQDIKHMKGTANKLSSGGLTFAPSPQTNQIWVVLQFLKSAALVTLQDKILKTNFAAKSELHSSKGDNYQPHCTLALLEGLRVPELKPINFEIFRREFADLKLVVGINGENLTFIEPKFS